jgi:transcriptional regulator with XRE-family HTH domain
MERVGEKLRKIRLQWKLSLREVEKRSLDYAQKWGNRSYQISASWLDRVEHGKHELAVNKLIVLSEIYSVPLEDLLPAVRAVKATPQGLRQHPSPNGTILTEGPLEQLAQSLMPEAVGPFDETRLIPAENVPLPTRYRWGIIGKQDRALDPMVPANSIVQVDTRRRAISARKDWTNEFQRPIHFLMTRDAFFCGWCELDKNSEWLTLIPHPLSPASSRRWKYGKEIENLGRVVAVTIRLLPEFSPE